ncbi:hypothetical protein DENIT_80263 [Pseudomonas veronii]|uniref:hypothetical protein n=1 Tax=Pseudomonas veronii TaxID=76761 RepID=UPI001771992B|nr:hypothetical protein [Pseudomonas veronii]CAD0266346.1 hypothetical protein DENIT_80263 [Pseudomonas veronii]
MSLNMEGQIDGVFESVEASRTVDTGGTWVDGIWTPGTPSTTPYIVNIQPASDREVDFLRQGGERITDARRIYINQGDMQLIDQTGTWEFLGQQWKATKCDNRYWRNYCKVIVMRIDDQSGGPA